MMKRPSETGLENRSPRARQLASTGMLALAGSVLLQEPAHAYLDPGTGSIILQSILAGIAVAMGVLRLYWQRFKGFLAGLAGARRERDAATDDGPDAGSE